MIRRLWLKWRVRNETYEHLAENYLILIKSARRCAHDLDHAIGSIDHNSTMEVMLRDRAKQWLKIFSPTGIKDYRLELHFENDSLRDSVDTLVRELKKHNIPIPIDLNEEPF